MKKLTKTRWIFYGLGIVILTLGISLTILSDLGTSPFDALLVGLSMKVGLTVGSWEIIIAFILIFCNSILKRNRPEFLGLLTAIITGIGIDMWLFSLPYLINPELWLSQFICLGIGLLVVGFGTALYLHANFAPIPVDLLMLDICVVSGLNLVFSRVIVNLLFLTMALLFSGPIRSEEH